MVKAMYEAEIAGLQSRASTRIAELEAAIRDAHDALLMSEGILRKHNYEATADEVRRVYDRLCALVTMTKMQ